MDKRRIPIGIESFERIRTDNCYYVDKTKFIEELLDDRFAVNLITRPRRFGKTLMMSMLENFFDIRKDSKQLFEGLMITQNEELCSKWMNQYPVLFLTFKDIARMNFQKSFRQLSVIISDLSKKHKYLLTSEKVDDTDKEELLRLIKCEGIDTDIENSLKLLTRMLYAHYGKKVILLIDEYDVPLAKANEYKYYREMLDMIRGIMSISLKTNEYLNFAVVTGCLRIAKESIFTGTNHFVNNSIENGSYMNAFGFTEEEVQTLLKDLELEDHFEELKQWYDGYHFGEYDMYCPWDVVNHVAVLQKNPNKKPQNYWKDTSHNNIIRKFIGNPNVRVNEKFETLLSDGCVAVDVKEDLTYDFEHSSENNFWSILYLTGYLTRERKDDDEITYLKIPNEEVKTIFADTIVEWFKDTMKDQNRDDLFRAWWSGDADKLEEMISDILFDTVSYFDYKEDYYHALIVGMFAGAGYSVSSNDEVGFGRADVIIKDARNRRAIIVETKYSTNTKKSCDIEIQLDKDCDIALKQIEDMQYIRGIPMGYKTILCYGIAFHGKICKVKVEK